MFLSSQYAEFNPATEKESLFPNLFLFTDYYPWSTPTWSYPGFLYPRIIYEDRRNTVKALSVEKLPSLDLPLDPEIVTFPTESHLNGTVIFLQVQITSNRFGVLEYPVVYAFVENEPFCSRILLSMKCEISHIIHIRYGSGFGGGRSTGVWLLNVLQRLNCKVFITDNRYGRESGDMAAYRIYKNLRGTPPPMRVIRTINGEQWSRHGDVSWNVVES